MDDMFRQVSVGVIIAAIGGLWVFATTRASMADVNAVKNDVRQLEYALEGDIDEMKNNIESIKDTFHKIRIDQARFQTQVREKLDIREHH